MSKPWDVFFETWHDTRSRLRAQDSAVGAELPLSVLAARSETIYYLLAERRCVMRDCARLVDLFVAETLLAIEEGQEGDAVRERLQSVGAQTWREIRERCLDARAPSHGPPRK